MATELKSCAAVTRACGDNENSTCPICEDIMDEATMTSDGQEVIVCKGIRYTWLHRRSVYRSVKVFHNQLGHFSEVLLGPARKGN